MTLWRYILRSFLKAVLAVLAALSLVIVLFMMVEANRRFSDSGAGSGELIAFALNQAAGVAYKILPLVFLLASLVCFLRLARGSELVVMRASGVSALRLITVPVVAALVLGLASAALLNPFVAATASRALALEEGFGNARPSRLSFSREGVWLRQSDAGGQTVIQAARSNGNGTVLTQVVMHRFDDRDQLYARLQAPVARLAPGAWRLHDASVWEKTAGAERFALQQSGARFDLPTDLTSNQILESFSPPGVISIWNLPAFIVQMEEAGFSGRRHLLFLQTELAQPVVFAAMVLIGAVFALRPARLGQTGVRVLVAILAGFAVYFIKDFAGSLGARAHIPVAVAAWTPPVAAIFLALGLLLHLEDG